MKKGLPLILSAVCLVVLCIGYVILVKQTNKEADETSASGNNILTIDADTVVQLSITSEEGKLELTKQDDTWSVAGNKKLTVDADKVTQTLQTIASLQAEREIENVTDLGQYGLTAPAMTIELKDRDGNGYTLCWGDTNDTTGYTYLYRKEQADSVYTVSSSVADTIGRTETDYEQTATTETEQSTEE